MRDVLQRFAGNAKSPAEFFGKELLDTAANRAGAEPIGDVASPEVSVLLDYVDFGDVLSLSRRHQSIMPERYADQVRSLHSEFERLSLIRNRVMHSRPLEFDDLARTSDLARVLLREPQHWPHLLSARDGLERNPEQVLKLSIPPYTEPTKILHNLPLADFDETGFIGRKQVLSNLLKACSGPYPVITVVGEGGLGKTSLALKAAYEILDSKKFEFEAIIFVTAKATQLTANEISRIKGAINSSLGLMEAAIEVLGGNSEQKDAISDLKELLNTFKILLIIDNLETVLDHRLKDVLEDLPFGSKILITTRIGLGAFEFPVQLQGLSDIEAVQLLRATAETRGNNKLTSASNERLSNYCKRMRNNPLHIKWFVSAVQTGKRPEEVLADESLFLKFCLSNVFDQISDDAKSIVRALLSLGGSYTVAELSYLTQIDEGNLLRGVQELMRTNMFIMTSSHLGNTYESSYELSQLARAYLTKFYPAGKERQLQFIALKNKLVSAGEEQKKAAIRNPLSPYTVHTRSRSDWVIAKHLKDALSFAKDRDFEDALKLVEKAKILAPDFYECFRVEGWINALMGNASEAYDSYERAIATEPEAPNARTMFAGFLLRDLRDAEKAAEQLAIAMKLAPLSPEPKLEYARCCLYLARFDEASAILDELSKTPDCHERVRTKIVDLQIQMYCRTADFHSQNQEPMKAIDALHSLKEYFDDIIYPDPKMYERLARVRRSCILSRNSVQPGSPHHVKAEEALLWIDTKCSEHETVNSASSIGGELDLSIRGTIARIHSSQKFGFIRTTEGEEIFFHVTGVADEEVLAVGVGARVRFHLSVDYMNRAVAIDIQRT
ncbi:cold shock domain-containing protein [Stenotrophomonas sp. 169]|uniref:tetratricopeptide repeat protein n=1 Tax=Stenotrophomonas sp. 169 TaxID=2770322 RepID=UPI001662603F|nr:tetratricopeptide repeat protein [Stenotrophomonas sp. 169]QNR96418.1 cold shock domain-containing protein [Stenotrophomonas sp. 169]